MARLAAVEHREIFEVVGILELLFGVEVIQGAEEFIESVRGGQMLVKVAQVVLAELRGHVALRLQQLRKRHVARLQALLGSRQSDLKVACTESALTGDE